MIECLRFLEILTIPNFQTIHIYYILLNLLYSKQIMNFLFLDWCSSLIFHNLLGVCGILVLKRFVLLKEQKISSGIFFFFSRQRNVIECASLKLQYLWVLQRCVSKWCPSGLGYKKHSSAAASYFFLFMFPISSLFGQELSHLGL